MIWLPHRTCWLAWKAIGLQSDVIRLLLTSNSCNRISCMTSTLMLPCTRQVTMLIDKARSNTELLSDMLVNSSAASRSDEFEGELIKDLLTEVGRV